MITYDKLYDQKEDEHKREAEIIKNDDEYENDLSTLRELSAYDNFQKGYANLFLGIIEEILNDNLDNSIKPSLSKIMNFSFSLEYLVRTIGNRMHGGKIITSIRSTKDTSHQWDFTGSQSDHNDIFKYIIETLQFYGFKKVGNLPFEHKYSGSRVCGELIETTTIFKATIPFCGTIKMLINMYYSEIQRIEYEGTNAFIIREKRSR